MLNRKFGLLMIILALILNGCKDYDRIRNAQLNKEYPYTNRDSTFCGMVDSTFTFDMSVPKGSIYIKLSDGRKFVAIRNAYPRDVWGVTNITNSSLENILDQGDTIYKLAGRDSLYVLKNGLRYTYFIPTKQYSDSVFQR